MYAGLGGLRLPLERPQHNTSPIQKNPILIRSCFGTKLRVDDTSGSSANFSFWIPSPGPTHQKHGVNLSRERGGGSTSQKYRFLVLRSTVFCSFCGF